MSLPIPTLDTAEPSTMNCPTNPTAEPSGLSVADLIVLQSTLENALAALRRLAKKDAPAVGPPTISHSVDFASVSWRGDVYSFSPKQRIIIAALWRAMEAGHHYVGKDALLVEAESDCTRLRELFGKHPAWGKLIVLGKLTGGRAGTYRLAPLAA